MLKFKLVPMVLLGSLSCAVCAQTPAAAPQPTGWAKVEALPANTKMTVHRSTGTLRCRFVSATDDSLTCQDSHASSTTVARSDVRSIRIAHRGRSAGVGAAIGFAGGAIAGAATCRGDDFIGPGGCAVVLGVPLGLIGALTGVGTDFTGNTLYHSH